MRRHPELNELWVQERIASDPSIIGLGDLVLRERERPQPGAGRLDLLLQDRDSQRRFEVEIQLGATNESHIIRTIEYWDIERKRYPQYDHCAVLIAEDITSRFLNVVSLFNGTFPLIAIQMQALKFENNIALVFTKILSELSRGVVEEDEEEAAAPADRQFWEQRASAATVKLADEILSLAKERDASISLKYNDSYIGITRSGMAFNFITFRPRKKTLNIVIKVAQNEETDALLNKSGLERLANTPKGYYRISIRQEDLSNNRDLIKQLVIDAYSNHDT